MLRIQQSALLTYIGGIGFSVYDVGKTSKVCKSRLKSEALP